MSKNHYLAVTQILTTTRGKTFELYTYLPSLLFVNILKRKILPSIYSVSMQLFFLVFDK